MVRYRVDYSEHRMMSIEIEADTPEEAERIVMDGEADYNTSHEDDAEVVSVNYVEEIPEDQL
jgi:hypothetical protein